MNRELNEAMIAGLTKDAVQWLIGAALEYGGGAVTLPAAGSGVVIGPALETVVDAAFATKSVKDALATLASVVKTADEFAEILNMTLAAKDSMKTDLAKFYKQVRVIVGKFLLKAGQGGKKKVDELIKRLQTSVSSMLSRLADAIVEGFKVIIPDSTVSAGAGAAVRVALSQVGDNIFSVIKKAIESTGKLSKFITDPEAVSQLTAEAIDAVIGLLNEQAGKMESGSTLGYLIKGGPSGVLVQKAGAPGMRKVAEFLTGSKDAVVEMVKDVASRLVPAVISLAAVYQVLAKKEYTTDEPTGKKEESVKRLIVSLVNEMRDTDHLARRPRQGLRTIDRCRTASFHERRLNKLLR